MTELEYICPLAHCVNLTWYAGGLLYFAGKESDRVTLYYTHLGGKPDSIIEKLREILENYLSKTEPKYYPPVENLLDLIYETYTESNPVAPRTTVVGRAARARDKEFEAWLREIPGMDRLVEDCVGGKIPLWEEIDLPDSE